MPLIPRTVRTSRGTRPARTSIVTTRDLPDIDVQAGTTGVIDAYLRHGRYVVRFDRDDLADATLRPDEFTIVSQRPERPIRRQVAS